MCQRIVHFQSNKTSSHISTLFNWVMIQPWVLVLWLDFKVADGEEVASIYTPTPRNPRNTVTQYTINSSQSKPLGCKLFNCKINKKMNYQFDRFWSFYFLEAKRALESLGSKGLYGIKMAWSILSKSCSIPFIMQIYFIADEFDRHSKHNMSENSESSQGDTPKVLEFIS